jgi:hypothetical protein
MDFCLFSIWIKQATESRKNFFLQRAKRLSLFNLFFAFFCKFLTLSQPLESIFPSSVLGLDCFGGDVYLKPE